MRLSDVDLVQYFHALLRQDQAFYDVYDVGGVASQVEANASKFRRGIGRKFAEGIEFATTGVFGLAYALVRPCVCVCVCVHLSFLLFPIRERVRVGDAF